MATAKKSRGTKAGRKTAGRNQQSIVPKEKLLDEIRSIVRTRDLSQAEVVALTGEAQSQISLLLNGKLRGFSTDRLIRILLRLGRNVEISTRPTSGRRPGTLRVIAR